MDIQIIKADGQMNSSQKQIMTCLRQKDQDRDQNWQEKFLNLFPSACVTLLSSQPQQGSDGMPYFLVQVEESSKEPASKLLYWLSQKGVGLVVHPEKTYPDYIFTYGMIWYFKEKHIFLGTQRKNFTTPKNAKAVLGQPSTEFLPKYVRSILKQFFFDQGIYKPQIIMIGPDRHSMDICFCLESLGNPPTSEHQGILKAISWFLPQHYSIAISEKNTNLPFAPL